MQPRWIIQPPVDLIEPVPAPEIYIDDIAAVEINGSCARVICCTYEMVPGSDALQKIVKVIIRRPAEGALRAAGILNSVAQHVFYGEGPTGFKPRPVRRPCVVRRLR